MYISGIPAFPSYVLCDTHMLSDSGQEIRRQSRSATCPSLCISRCAAPKYAIPNSILLDILHFKVAVEFQKLQTSIKPLMFHLEPLIIDQSNSRRARGYSNRQILARTRGHVATELCLFFDNQKIIEIIYLVWIIKEI